MSHSIVRTTSGASAVRCLDTDETMHPGVGPIAEAEQLYVQQSKLAERLRTATEKLVLFDVGLGAGSNALAARAVSEAAAGRTLLEIVSYERDLGAIQLALEHPEEFALTGEAGIAARALVSAERHETAKTRWILRHGDLLTLLAKEQAKADIVFWDPFSPKSNPLLWTVDAFRAMRNAAADRCTLYTYSASTATRIALLLAGWAVGVGDSIGTKKQTTAAAVRVEDLNAPLDSSWLRRLTLPTTPLPSDAPDDFVKQIAKSPQFS